MTTKGQFANAVVGDLIPCRKGHGEFAVTASMLRRRDFACPTCDRDRAKRNGHDKLPHRLAAKKAWNDSHPEKRREYQRRGNVNFRQRHPEQWRANEITGRAIRNGLLVRQPCETCGAEKTEAHHEDYSKPLVVRWFCKKHHEAVHHGSGAAQRMD